MQNTITRTAPSPESMLLPLFLAQFICSYAGTTVNTALHEWCELRQFLSQ